MKLSAKHGQAKKKKKILYTFSCAPETFTFKVLHVLKKLYRIFYALSISH